MTTSSTGEGASATADKPLPPLRIGRMVLPLPIVQGGMGVGISNARLAHAVSGLGALGTLSSACIDAVVSKRVGKKVTTREAMRLEVEDAKGGADLPVAVNIMVALVSTYEDSVLGALDGGAEAIISGAGLPLNLPSIVSRHPRGGEVMLVPIVSSGRAAEIIFKRWGKSGRVPDAMVVEGPEAGGHLGWKSVREIEDEANDLENILAEVLAVAKKYGDVPVIAAGGVYTNADILRMLSLGASGVQIGTRFLATEESGATDEFKKALVECDETSVIVAVDPGSPCGLPFRILSDSGMYLQTLKAEKPVKCDKGYLLMNGKCLAKESPENYFCICNGLLSAIGANSTDAPPLFTVGTNASRVDRIMSVAALLKELAPNN